LFVIIDNMKRTKTTILWCLVVVWMAVIFCFSNQSSVNSGAVSTAVAETVYENVDLTPERFEYKNDNWLIAHYEMLLRKAAHLFIFAVLGALFCLALSSHLKKKSYVFLFSVLLGIIYAVSDEIHQHFVPGRSFLLKDILIDSIGVIIGAGVIILIMFLISKIKKRAPARSEDRA